MSDLFFCLLDGPMYPLWVLIKSGQWIWHRLAQVEISIKSSLAMADAELMRLSW